MCCSGRLCALRAARAAGSRRGSAVLKYAKVQFSRTQSPGLSAPKPVVFATCESTNRLLPRLALLFRCSLHRIPEALGAEQTPVCVVRVTRQLSFRDTGLPRSGLSRLPSLRCHPNFFIVQGVQFFKSRFNPEYQGLKRFFFSALNFS